MTSSKLRLLAGHLPTVVISLTGVVFLVPFVWLLIVAFQAHGTLQLSGGGGFTLSHFVDILTEGNFRRSLYNSLYLACATTIFTCVIAVLAAYPLSRFRSRAQNWFVYVLVFLTGLPVVAVMIPAYDLFVAANLINSRFWTAWFMTATALPFGTWIARGFIDAVPLEIEEAAWIDGTGRWGSLRWVVLPMIVPGICVVAVYTFVNAWSDFFVPFILLQNQNIPASVEMYNYFGQYDVDYSNVAAFALMYSLPPVALYLIAAKWVGRGFNLGGATKG